MYIILFQKVLKTKNVHNVRKWPNYVLLGLTVLGKLIERSTDFLKAF
jgi:hypothetical protein